MKRPSNCRLSDLLALLGIILEQLLGERWCQETKWRTNVAASDLKNQILELPVEPDHATKVEKVKSTHLEVILRRKTIKNLKRIRF